MLREYQSKAVQAAVEAKKNGVIVMPTGSGKSHVIAGIAGEIDKKIIVLQPTKEILEQNHQKLIAEGHFDIGVYSASAGSKTIGDITLATIGSVVKKRHLFDDFGFMIIDECHLVNSKGGMYEKFINGLKLPVIGLTATPYRLRSYRHFATGEPTGESRILTRTRPKLFKKIIHVTQIKELYDNGFLSLVKYVQNFDYNARTIKSNSTGAGYDDKSVLAYNQRLDVINKAIKIARGTSQKHCLVFTQFRSESKQVVQGLQSMGVSCVEISAESKKKEREQILRDFKSGKIKCVVNVGVLTTGFDFPELDCIVLARPTKSVALYYQMVGRGIRISEGKDFCAVYDLCGNVKQFGQIETFNIYDQNGNGMWRLRSDAGYLTGIDLTTGQNLEKIKFK